MESHRGRQNNGAPKDVQALIPKICEYVIYMAKETL